MYETFKALLVVLFSAIASFLSPIWGFIYAALAVFLLNFIIGYITDLRVNKANFDLKKAKECIADEHPSASAKEIFDMKLTVIETVEPTIEEQNASIRRAREMAYRRESDSLYMAFAKYSELGETEKAAAAKANWLQKVQEIDMRLPYV